MIRDEVMKLKHAGAIKEVVSMLEPPCWKVYVDGATNQRGFRVGLVLESHE